MWSILVYFLIPIIDIHAKQYLCPTNLTCLEKETCCSTNTGLWGCCPFENGVCCDDGIHCCPQGDICLSNGTCSSSTTNISSFEIQFNENNIQCPDGSSCPDQNTCCQLSSGSYGCCPIENAVCCSDHIHCCPQNYHCDVQHGRCTKKVTEFDDVPCPGGSTSCPDGETCCILQSGEYGCCPLVDAVCCDDHVHCCPNGYRCDVEKGQCIKDISIPWFTKNPSIKMETNLIKLNQYSNRKEENEYISSRKLILKDIKSSLETIQCPDEKSYCPEETTCCQLNDDNYGCCPYSQGKCCSDKIHCCPNGYSCDQTGKRCTKHFSSSNRSVEHSLKHLIKKKSLIEKDQLQRLKLGDDQLCPDGITKCSLLSTCCQNNNQPTNYSCCPYSKGVCCGTNGSVCCPNKYICNPSQLSCQLSDINLNRNERIESDYYQCGLSDVACSSDQTCCRTYGSSDAEFACCNFPNAQCCEDGRHCCPQDTICDIRNGGCRSK